MPTSDAGDSELRQELREAWRQVADLRWQLQAEQQHNRRHERLRAAQGQVLADTLQQHEEALADRDEEIAHLEDTQTGLASAWQKEREETQRKSARELADAQRKGHSSYDGSGLRLAVDILSSCMHARSTRHRDDELSHWAQHCAVMLTMIDTLNETGAGSAEAVLVRVAEGHPGISVDVQLTPVPLSRDEIILCGLLLYNHLSRNAETAGPLSGGHVQVCVVRDASGGPSHVRITLPQRGASIPDEAADAIWQSILARLGASIDEGFSDRGMLVRFAVS